MQHCEICNKSVKKGNMRFHLKSKVHLENENKNNNVQEVNEFKENDSIEEIDNDNNDYLSDFNNTYKFTPINEPAVEEATNAILLGSSFKRY